MWWERGAWDSLYPLLSLLLYKWILGKPPVLHVLMAWLVFQGNIHRCSLYQIAPVWVFREQIETRGILGSFMAQIFLSFGACTKLELVWFRGRVHPSQWGNKRNTSLHVVSKEELVRDVRVSVRLGCHDTETVGSSSQGEWGRKIVGCKCQTLEEQTLSCSGEF